MGSFNLLHTDHGGFLDSGFSRSSTHTNGFSQTCHTYVQTLSLFIPHCNLSIAFLLTSTLLNSTFSKDSSAPTPPAVLHWPCPSSHGTYYLHNTDTALITQQISSLTRSASRNWDIQAQYIVLKCELRNQGVYTSLFSYLLFSLPRGVNWKVNGDIPS